MTRYVVGFLFWENQVLLTLKDHPEWQRGKWNGVGGKIEEGEDSVQAMTREGNEEIGRNFPWQEAGVVDGADFQLHVFRSFHQGESHPYNWTPKNNDVGERLEWIDIGLAIHLALHSKCIPNLSYLIPLCLDKNLFRFRIAEDHTKDEVLYGKDQG